MPSGRARAAVVLALGLAAPSSAHLCDNVFRQADKLIVKPEVYNLVIKDEAVSKVFLQNNMDRGIAEISLVAESPSFDFAIAPEVMRIPRGQRVYFTVTMRPKPGTATGYGRRLLEGVGRVVTEISALARGVFCGGGALSPAFCAALEKTLGAAVTVPQKTQFVTALGAALVGERE